MTQYQRAVADFEKHCRALVKSEYPSVFGGKMAVGHHLLRRLNHPNEVNDPHIIVPLTASQHDEIHAPEPTISVKELIFDQNNTIVGVVFLYHGKEWRWDNSEWVKVWNSPA